jgi:indolepyruvate ferredoxin oxidoreductase beta subunit
VKDPLNLVISGVGGQGNVLIGGLLGQALVRSGYLVMTGETFGVSQRGGAVTSHIRISRKRVYGPIIPDREGDVILGLEPLETLRALGQHGNPEIDTVTNSRPVYPINVLAGDAEYPPVDELRELIGRLSRRAVFVDASEIALRLGAAVLANMVMAGALVAAELIPLSRGVFEEYLADSMSGETLQRNLVAFDEGFKSVAH